MLTVRALAVAAGLIAVVGTLIVVLADPLPAWAASPTPGEPGAGDPRSSGAGPGFVGDPLTAILVMLALGFGSALVTALYVRLTRPRERQ